MDTSAQPAASATPDRAAGVPPMAVVVGVDIGGTRIKVCALDADGEVRTELTVPTPAGLGERIGQIVAELLREVAAGTGSVDGLGAGGGSRPAGMSKAPGMSNAAGMSDLADGSDAVGGSRTALRPVAVAVAVPGIVDDQRGVGVFSANLGWADLDIRSAVRDATCLPVLVGHDVRAGLLAETTVGAAVGEQHVLFVPIGTGIAGALMVDGRLLVADGWSGELGHVVVVPGGPLCGCGARGCLEAVASASAIARLYSEQVGAPHTAADVARAVGEGDPDARAVWGEAIAALATVLHTVVASTGVRTVLIGGGLSNAGSLLLDPLQAALSERASVVPAPRLALAGLGDRAGSIGAALMARRLL